MPVGEQSDKFGRKYAFSDYKYSSFGDYKRKQNDLLHKNAIKNYKDKFQNWESYLNYHNITTDVIFLGMDDEIYIQKKDVAKMLLWKLKEQEEIDEVRQIMEEPTWREKYIERLRNTLRLSKIETCRLYTEIENEYLI